MESLKCLLHFDQFRCSRIHWKRGSTWLKRIERRTRTNWSTRPKRFVQIRSLYATLIDFSPFSLKDKIKQNFLKIFCTNIGDRGKSGIPGFPGMNQVVKESQITNEVNEAVIWSEIKCNLCKKRKKKLKTKDIPCRFWLNRRKRKLWQRNCDTIIIAVFELNH